MLCPPKSAAVALTPPPLPTSLPTSLSPSLSPPSLPTSLPPHYPQAQSHVFAPVLWLAYQLGVPLQSNLRDPGLAILHSLKQTRAYSFLDELDKADVLPAWVEAVVAVFTSPPLLAYGAFGQIFGAAYAPAATTVMATVLTTAAFFSLVAVGPPAPKGVRAC